MWCICVELGAEEFLVGQGRLQAPREAPVNCAQGNTAAHRCTMAIVISKRVSVLQETHAERRQSEPPAASVLGHRL